MITTRLAGSSIRPDFIIGDRFGASASAALSDVAVGTLEDLGFRVVRNKPYAGGFITEHYGNPTAGLHSVQFELNRALYMDERRHAPAKSFSQVAADLEIIADRLAAIPWEDLRPYRAAAE